MINLYLFNINSRGALYGIGTYIDNLIRCGKNMGMNVHVVEFNMLEKEFSIDIKKGVRYIKIPGSVYPVNTGYKAYLEKLQTSACFLLKDIVDNDEKNIFHLNRMEFLELAKGLKENFNGKIVLTLHYTEWSLTLFGNKKKLNRIIKQNPIKLSEEELTIHKEIEQGHELINSYCNKVIAISRHSYDDIILVYKTDPDKVVLINNSLQDRSRPVSDNKKKELRKKYLIEDDETVLMFAGRLDEVKGIYILIDAFTKILEHDPKCRLLIAGSGNFESVVNKSMNISSKISFLGFVPPKRTLSIVFDR